MRRSLLVLLAVAVAGCPAPRVDPSDSGVDPDASVIKDAGEIEADAGTPDAGESSIDASWPDAGEVVDAGPTNDAGSELDAGDGDGGAFDAGLNCSALLGPDFEPVETRCDGIDNDCDGRVDQFTPTLIHPLAYRNSVPTGSWRWLLWPANNGFWLLEPYPRIHQLDNHGHPVSPVVDLNDSEYGFVGDQRVPIRTRSGISFTQSSFYFSGSTNDAGSMFRIDLDESLTNLRLGDGGLRAISVAPPINNGQWRMSSVSLASIAGDAILHTSIVPGSPPARWSVSLDDGGIAVPDGDAGYWFTAGAAIDGGFELYGTESGGPPTMIVIRRVDERLAPLTADEIHPLIVSETYPRSLLFEPGNAHPTIALVNPTGATVSLWRFPYASADWSEWYSEAPIGSVSREGFVAFNSSPPLMVAQTRSHTPDAGTNLLVAKSLDGGMRVLLSGDAVGNLSPSVVSTDAGTFIVSFEYDPPDAGGGVYTMEFCPP